MVFVPFVGLWLILYGMQEAIYSTLERGGLHREMIVAYGFISLLIVFLVCRWGRRVPKIIFLLAFGSVCGILLWKNSKEIVEDIRILAFYVNQKYQVYTGQNLVSAEWCQKGDLGHNVVLVILCSLLGLYIAWAVIRLHSKLLTMVPIILIYCGALLLGVTPGQAAALILMIGTALEMLWISEEVRGKSSVKLREKPEQIHGVKRTIIFAVFLSVVLSVSWYISGRMSASVFRDVKKIQQRQSNMEKELQVMVEKRRKQLQAWFGLDSGGYLSNLPPEHLDKEVFSVTVSAKPENSMYLRGFVGDIYHDGKWKSSEQAAKTKRRRNGGTWNGEYNASRYLKFDSEERDVSIQYTSLGKRSKYLYLPYSKSGDYNQISREERKLCRGESDDFLELYQDTAKRMPNHFNEISENLISDVQNILWRNAEYSLSLDPLPRNQDYAEYFLFYSQKGYCEHFATAGTLLLRNMNHVARYVSGYRIPPDRFVQSKDGTYTAKVLDSDAHAWSEVWVRDQYWMPQEMTPSDEESEGVMDYSSISGSEEDSTWKVDEWNIPVQTDAPSSLPTPGLAKTDEPEKNQAPSAKSDEPRQKAAVRNSQASKGTEHIDGGGRKEQGGIQKWWLGLDLWQKIVLAAGLLMSAGMIASGLTWRAKKQKKKARMIRLRTENRQQYIRLRLGVFLDRLRHAGIAVRSSMPEEQWIQTISERLQNRPGVTEIERAAELVRRAAYSREIVTEQEVDWFDDYCTKIECWAKKQKKVK